MNPPSLFFKTILLMASMALSTEVATPQEAKVRTSLATKGQLWVGQQLAISVDLLVPGSFSGTPAFDLPNLQTSGILLMPPAESPVISSEQVDGIPYSVQSYTFFAFTQRAGGQSIPPFDIRFFFKRNPLDATTVPAIVKTEAISWMAALPHGGEKLGMLISSHDLKVGEEWHPDPAQAKPKIGDAFTRTITYSASDLPAMIFPPFPHGTINGVGIYPSAPEISERGNRGTIVSSRREKIVYVCEEPGWITIPLTSFTWWNLNTLEFQKATFPERTFQVAPNPAMAASSSVASSESPGRNDRTSLIAMLSLAIVAFAVWVIPRSFMMRLIASWRPVPLAPLNPPEK